MDSSELASFAKAVNPKFSDAEAADFALDVLSSFCSHNCARLKFDDFIIYLQNRARQSDEKRRADRNPLWPGFAINREVVDAINPRADKSKAAAVISIKWNDEAQESKDKRQETVLGALRLLSRNFGEGRTQLEMNTGVDFDIDGSKPKNETTISFGIPVSVSRIRKPDNWFESFALGLTPKWITDRSFNREVYEVALNGSFASAPIAAGFIRPAPVRRDGIHLPKVTGYWIPSAQMEFGTVRDAGGNAKLIPLEGHSYTRVVPRAKITLFPNFISEQLQIDVDALERYDLTEKWTRPYLETRLSYDLVFKGVAQLTVVYRRGKKPPQFSKLNDVLFGVGLKL
jgi:hypothetical protein